MNVRLRISNSERPSDNAHFFIQPPTIYTHNHLGKSTSCSPQHLEIMEIMEIMRFFFVLAVVVGAALGESLS